MNWQERIESTMQPRLEAVSCQTDPAVSRARSPLP
jgi:hypothetical protein